MSDRTTPAEAARPPCDFCSFGLIVTGVGEREFLSTLFRSLMARAGCEFAVLRRIGQRNPITSSARLLRMVGSGQIIPTEDEREIAIPARQFLRQQTCRFLILIDDVEHDRRPIISQVFNRYRAALDTLLAPEERRRAAVHFLANMLEAYYFAHSAAVNAVLEMNVLLADFLEDVETIRHPKNDLKRLCPDFDERVHGARIVARLDIDHVLSNPKTCAFLRSLFGWCVQRLLDHCPVYDVELRTCFNLRNGLREPLTANQ